MWSERHKYPPCPVVITSASAIDSPNKGFKGHRTCTCLMGCWWIWLVKWGVQGFVLIGGWCCWNHIVFFCRDLGCKTGIFIQSQSLVNLQRTPDLHNSCMSTWGEEERGFASRLAIIAAPLLCALIDRVAPGAARFQIDPAPLLLLTVCRKDTILLKMSALRVCFTKILRTLAVDSSVCQHALCCSQR